MILKKILLLFLLIALSSCKTPPKIEVKQEEPVVEIEKAPPDKIGDLWLDDNTYMVSATGHARSNAKDDLKESALKAAYELAYIKIEHAFLKEMRVKDNTATESIKKIINKYIVEIKIEYINDSYIEISVIVKANFLRQNLKNNTLERLL